MWRHPATSDLLNCLLADELSAFETASVAAGHDVVADIMADAVAVYRAALRTGGAALGAAGTLPEGLIGAAMDHAAYRVLSRVGANITASRRRLYEDAHATRKSVAEGKLTYLSPDESDGPALAAHRPIVRPRTLSLTRTTQQGI